MWAGVCHQFGLLEGLQAHWTGGGRIVTSQSEAYLQLDRSGEWCSYSECWANMEEVEELRVIFSTAIWYSLCANRSISSRGSRRELLICGVLRRFWPDIVELTSDLNCIGTEIGHGNRLSYLVSVCLTFFTLFTAFLCYFGQALMLAIQYIRYKRSLTWSEPLYHYVARSL